MSKISLDQVLSGFNLSNINTNFQRIQDILNNKVLFRDNPVGEPNTIQQDIDMNGHSILNVDTLGVTKSLQVQGLDLKTEVQKAAQSAAASESSNQSAALNAQNAANSAVQAQHSADTVNVANILGLLSGIRNYVINGDMASDLRNAGAAVTATFSNLARPVDLFQYYYEGSGSVTGQQSSGDAPTGFKYYLRTTVASTGTQAPNESVCLRQNIEGSNVVALAWGTSSAKSTTLSFWYRSSVAGTHSGAIRNSANTRSFPFSFTVNAANTWEYKKILVPGDTTGTWNTDNTVGVCVSFNLSAGSSRQAAAGAWVGSWVSGVTGAVNLLSTLNATVDITGVQFEPGDNATPFNKKFTSIENSLIKRYLRKIAVTVPTSTTPLQLIIDMRSIPNISGGGTGFTSTNTTADILNCYQTTAASQTLILSAEL